MERPDLADLRPGAHAVRTRESIAEAVREQLGAAARLGAAEEPQRAGRTDLPALFPDDLGLRRVAEAAPGGIEREGLVRRARYQLGPAQLLQLADQVLAWRRNVIAEDVD